MPEMVELLILMYIPTDATRQRRLVNVFLISEIEAKRFLHDWDVSFALVNFVIKTSLDIFVFQTIYLVCTLSYEA